VKNHISQSLFKKWEWGKTMQNNGFGREIMDYPYNIARCIYPVILLVTIFSILAFTEWRLMQQRIIVYEYGLRLKTHEQSIDFPITDITDMVFTKTTERPFGSKVTSTHFLFYVKSQNGRFIEINLKSFESTISRISTNSHGTIPDMPALVAFYDRWFKSRNIKR